MRRTRFAKLLGAFLLLVGATACSGGERPTLSDGSDSSAASDDGGPEETLPEGTEPERGGTLRLGLDGPIVADPAAASPASSTQLMVLDLLYDGLTERVDGAVEPALALGWVQREKGRLWRFTLREGATFSDGTQITAAEVKASLEHVARAGVQSFTATRLEPIRGYTDFAAGDADEITGIIARSDQPRVLDIRTDRRFDALADLLASPVYGIVEPDHVSDSDVYTTGPFIDPIAVDGVLQMRRRPGGHVLLDAVELHPYEDAEEATAALAAGEVDWAPLPEGAALPEGSVEVSEPFQTEVFLGLNSASPPLDEPLLRQAIASAVDRTRLVADGDAQGDDPLAVIVPAGVEGHDPDACGDRCAPDPDAAVELLEEAYPSGDVPEVPLDFDDSPEQEGLAEAVAEQLEAVGIPVELRPHPVDEYAQVVAAGEQGLFSLGWIGLFPTPEAYLTPLFHSRSADNLVGLDSRAVDDALDAGDWATAERAVLDDAVVVPLSQFRTRAAVADEVVGFDLAVDGTFDETAVWLDDGEEA